MKVDSQALIYPTGRQSEPKRTQEASQNIPPPPAPQTELRPQDQAEISGAAPVVDEPAAEPDDGSDADTGPVASVSRLEPKGSDVLTEKTFLRARTRAHLELAAAYTREQPFGLSQAERGTLSSTLTARGDDPAGAMKLVPTLISLLQNLDDGEYASAADIRTYQNELRQGLGLAPVTTPIPE